MTSCPVKYAVARPGPDNVTVPVDATGFPVCHIYCEVGWHPHMPGREQADSLAKQIAQLPDLQEKMT